MKNWKEWLFMFLGIMLCIAGGAIDTWPGWVCCALGGMFVKLAVDAARDDGFHTGAWAGAGCPMVNEYPERVK